MEEWGGEKQLQLKSRFTDRFDRLRWEVGGGGRKNGPVRSEGSEKHCFAAEPIKKVKPVARGRCELVSTPPTNGLTYSEGAFSGPHLTSEGSQSAKKKKNVGGTAMAGQVIVAEKKQPFKKTEMTSNEQAFVQLDFTPG